MLVSVVMVVTYHSSYRSETSESLPCEPQTLREEECFAARWTQPWSCVSLRSRQCYCECLIRAGGISSLGIQEEYVRSHWWLEMWTCHAVVWIAQGCSILCVTVRQNPMRLQVCDTCHCDLRSSTIHSPTTSAGAAVDH